jgi:hypothetical protein
MANGCAISSTLPPEPTCLQRRAQQTTVALGVVAPRC